MKRVLSLLLRGCGTSLCAGLLACNGILGIDSAALEPDGGAAGEGGVALNCESYCTLMDQSCGWQSNFPEYLSHDVCVRMCADFDTGNHIAADGTDTLGCRIAYAERAASAPDPNCRYAGLIGGGKCGVKLCNHFCDVDVQYCNFPPVSSPAYTNIADCMIACARYAYDTAGAELLSMESGNTLNCRLWHLNNAYDTTAHGQIHCPHTDLASTVCQ